MREVTLHTTHSSFDTADIQSLYEEVHNGIDDRRSGYASLALPRTTDSEQFASLADKFNNPTSVVTIGMGGSVRCSRAMTNALGLDEHHVLNTPDPRRVQELLDDIDVEDTVFHVASQSGATRETIAMFNAVRAELAENGYDITNRAVVTTRQHSPLEQYAEDYDIPVYTPPMRVTGRFSMFSSVGLVPVALLDGPVAALLAGAREALDEFEPTADSPAFAVASFLDDARADGYPNVALLPYATGFEGITSWFVQLWSESLGDAAADPTEPIHAQGPAVQHARLQQLLSGSTRTTPMFVVFDDYGDFRNLGPVMRETYEATRDALSEEGIPSLAFNLRERSPEDIAWLLMTLQLVTVVAGRHRSIPVFKNTEVNAIKNRLPVAELDRDEIEE